MQSLPVRIDCGLESASIVDSVGKFKDYIPKSMEKVFGYIGSTNNIRLVIYAKVGDEIYPFLYSYDISGNIIDSMYLMIKNCGEADDKIIPHSLTTIEKDFTVNMVDTSHYIHYIETISGYQKIADSIEITKITTKIDTKGYFTIANRSKEK